MANKYGGIRRVTYPYKDFDPATQRTLLREYNKWHRRLWRWVTGLWWRVRNWWVEVEGKRG